MPSRPLLCLTALLTGWAVGAARADDPAPPKAPAPPDRYDVTIRYRIIGGRNERARDFLATTITGDAAMGRGFFLTDAPLRDLDPVGSEAVYPDDLTGVPHDDGLIFGGTFWDLREALIEDLGPQAGIARTEELFHATLQRASGMTTAYVEVLVEDDDDGDLSNGTPNFCAIDDIFRLHGLAPGTFAGTFEAFRQDILPEDRAHVEQRIAHTLSTGQDHRIEYRIAPAGGELGSG